MNDLEKHLDEISNMDLEAILLTAHSFKRHRRMSKEVYEQLRNRISERLQKFGYELQPGCCGNFTANKVIQE